MIESSQFDIIVIGVGSMGSAASYYLAKRGYRVLGLEQFTITHEQGSHTGQSRIIRKAYFENSHYVPLLQRAYANWKNLEQETGSQLYYPVGLVYFGPTSHPLMQGVKQSAALYNIPLQKQDSANSLDKPLPINIPPDFETLFEPEAGFITPGKAILLYAAQAKKYGATIRANEKVIEWLPKGTGVEVVTEQGKYYAKKLIITAGAYSSQLLHSLRNKLYITRQFIAWVKPDNPEVYALGNFPCWMLASNDNPGCFYGFPILPQKDFGSPTGLKIAYHYPAEETDPYNVNREIVPSDLENLKNVLEQYFHISTNALIAYKICLYANSPDEDFVIDHLPGYDNNVVIACGFSGHGFKFASAIGEILADLAVDGQTDLPISFLSLLRFTSQEQH